MFLMNFAHPIARRRFLRSAGLAAAVAGLGLSAGSVSAAGQGPDEMIKKLSDELLDLIRSDQSLQRGDLDHVMAMVDKKVMPHVNFTRMTASAVGPAWRQATPEQRQRLQDEFKKLLVRTYAGALKQVDDQSVEVLPLRAGPDDNDVVVRTRVLGGREPVQVDYRMERAPDAPEGWRIYDLNVLGIWLVANYRSQFRQQINQNGIDGLIDALASRDKAPVDVGAKQ